MAERIIVTGASGFVGGRLIEFLLKHTDSQIDGASRRRSDVAR
jgi:uncharacterized protein YbjT (DUF2867 family)